MRQFLFVCQSILFDPEDQDLRIRELPQLVQNFVPDASVPQRMQNFISCG